MAAKKLMNVHEALEYLENLDVFSENDLSDDEDPSVDVPSKRIKGSKVNKFL